MGSRAVAAAVAVVVTCALAACGVPEVEPTKLLPNETGGGPGSVRASVLVEDALHELVADDSGAFTSHLYIGGGKTDFVDASGVWRVSTHEGELRLRGTASEGPQQGWDYRIFDDALYLRESTGREVGCWKAMGTREALPSQVEALLSAQGGKGRSSGTSAPGTVLLGAAAGVFGVQWTEVVRRAGASASEVRLPVTFSIERGRFVGWSVEGRDLLKAVRRAGVEVDQELASQVPAYAVRVILTKPGSDVDVEVPSDTC